MWNKFLSLSLGLFLSAALQAETLRAKLDWADRQDYVFAVEGLVESLMVAEGDEIKSGQLLAQLEQAPFEYQIKKLQANIARLQPKIFDAKLELERANELFDRTVLSEIELQKTDTIYKGLIAEEDSVKAELSLAQWQQKKSRLIATGPGRLVVKKMRPGAVVSAYSPNQLFLQVAALNTMLARASIPVTEALKLNKNTRFIVQLNDKEMLASWYSLAARSDQPGSYWLEVKFKQTGNMTLLAGLPVKIKY